MGASDNSDSRIALCAGSMACQIALQYVVPSLGCVTAAGLTLSPYPAIRKAVEDGTLGKLNTLPFGLLACNGLVWTVYSFYIKDWFIFAPNFFGWVCATLYTLYLLPMATHKARQLTVLGLVVIQSVIYLTGAIAFISGIQRDAALTLLGIVANAVLIMFYASPLATCFEVIKLKDSSSFQFPLALATVVNSILWTSYGFALSNWYIIVPNGLGIVFSVLQVTLIFVYPKPAATASTGTPASADYLVAE
ncbi:hypothetical protein HDU78_009041 [Chytriomyces hyalinus]|nr:hypothetical protein HDU78_009041 [Chytriomyces hyalinus]